MSAYTIIDAPQRSVEWHAARLGRLTGSCAGAMLTSIKSGEAAGRRNLRIRLVLERLTNRSQESDFLSDAMKTGIEREADAVGAYEVATGALVQTTGFLSHTTLMAGCSPDGFTGAFDTLVSIKCRQPAAHYDFLRKGTIPPESWSQMKHELWMTDALEHVYVSYNPDFPEKMQLKFGVFGRDAFDLVEYDGLARVFLAEVDLEVSAMKGWPA